MQVIPPVYWQMSSHSLTPCLYRRSVVAGGFLPVFPKDRLQPYNRTYRLLLFLCVQLYHCFFHVLFSLVDDGRDIPLPSIWQVVTRPPLSATVGRSRPNRLNRPFLIGVGAHRVLTASCSMSYRQWNPTNRELCNRTTSRRARGWLALSRSSPCGRPVQALLTISRPSSQSLESASFILSRLSLAGHDGVAWDPLEVGFSKLANKGSTCTFALSISFSYQEDSTEQLPSSARSCIGIGVSDATSLISCHARPKTVDSASGDYYTHPHLLVSLPSSLPFTDTSMNLAIWAKSVLLATA
jgi:hypothetical protein